MLAIFRKFCGWMRIDARRFIIFFILAAVLFLFATLASEAIEGDMMAFDRYLILVLRDSADPSLPIGPGWLNTAMRDWTALGGIATLTLLTATVAGYLLVCRKSATAIFLVSAVVSGALLGSFLKMGFDRPRPDIVAHLVEVNTTSFPSGHATNSAIVYLTLGALLARTHAERGIRAYVIAVSIILTATIGFSRIYLGVHWPSDVLAGWMVGGAWAAMCSLVALKLQRRRTLERSSAGLSA